MYKNETHSIYKQSNASLALLQMSVKALREVRCFYPPPFNFCLQIGNTSPLHLIL